MATREENLKKINDELEKLSDEELDNVAGGFPKGFSFKNIPNLTQATDEIRPDEARNGIFG